MASGSFRFERFSLDPQNRLLRRDDTPAPLNGRYLDALVLLVRERGRLVSKDRFLEEVWRGVPVTDEALTQCVRALRRELGDDAARPRFIETVPRHGYRFIAEVEWIEDEVDLADGPRSVTRDEAGAWRRFWTIGVAGALGGGAAGVIGGLVYGFAAAASSAMGASSVLLVLLCVTAAMALVGGAGVAFGIAGAGFVSQRAGPWTVFGGALGGMVVGAVVKLIGLDAFNLLFGAAPTGITGAMEGALLGGGVGLGAWLAERPAGPLRLRRGVALAGLAGAASGLLATLLGGRLMAGSLDLLARAFPQSRLRLDPVGGLAGEGGLGPAALYATSALEGFLFGACIVGAMLLARRGRRPQGRSPSHAGR